MKYIFLLFTTTLFFSGAIMAQDEVRSEQQQQAGADRADEDAGNQFKTLSIGRNMPDIREPLMAINQDNRVRLQEIKGENGTLVMFSCNTCPYVIKAQKRTRMMMMFAKEHGIGMIIINSNEAQRKKEDGHSAMKRYAEEQEYTVPYVVDRGSIVADAFGATRTPEVFLFDKEGILVYRGAMEDNPANPAESKEMYLESAITRMINGEKPKPATTKSIGCTIKRMK